MSELKHYGTKRHSGRYPWGSGEDPYQHGSGGFINAVNSLRETGMSEKEIANSFGLSTKSLRAKYSAALESDKQYVNDQVYKLKEKGYSNLAISEKLGISEASVRNKLKNIMERPLSQVETTTKLLKDRVDSDGYIDVGAGVERHLGLSRSKFDTALENLKQQGYTVESIQVSTTGKNKTTIKVLAQPGQTYRDIVQNKDSIKLINEKLSEDGKTWFGIESPSSFDSKRLQVVFAEEGGTNKDGVIELRRGVDELSLGGSAYAQVRIAVDGTHYLKGMAVYADDLPDGIDIRFNTNKKAEVGKLGALKELSDDPDNPFGAQIKANGQRHYLDANGNDKLSPINIVNEEGDWKKWSKSLASQFLSKQDISLIKQQLDFAYEDKFEEFKSISSLTNPVIKKKLMLTFSDECDSAAVHLKAAALPRQSTNVILPVQSLKPNEIYAPNYRNGEKIVLIRYPHGGIFEIPELVVNNKNKDAVTMIGKNAPDAVGIHPSVAGVLSGADFDGDHGLVIPNNQERIKHKDPLEDLKNFEPKVMYGDKNRTEEDRPKHQTMQTEMGKVSNLITDMSIRVPPAEDSDIARAVRHSMVVIDAEKHNLDYKKSYEENGIRALKEKYQGTDNAGAATIISRASSEVRVPKRANKVDIDAETGEKIYYESKKARFKDKVTGKEVVITEKSTKMAEAKDAFELVGNKNNPKEVAYAEYANKLKAMGNDARKEYLATGNIKVNKEAKEKYKEQVSSLDAKLNEALKNSPLERRAWVLANSIIEAKEADNPNMTAEQRKKVKSQAINSARARVGAHKQQIEITDIEWEAIQHGAISNNKLIQIIDNANLDRVRELATPRESKAMDSRKIARAKVMVANGYTNAEIADHLGVSTSTLINSLKGE